LAHRDIGKPKARETAMDFLRKVHIHEPRRVYDSYPHQISGGTKQRVGIAMALINSPDLLILDEPTTALDVTIQAGILDLIGEIIENEGVSALFISHDFGVIAKMCDTICVMHRGKIVESGKNPDILNNPGHDYTISLLEALRALSW
jgi:ABC-type dipeptide/oligopeptide/nickel transport system ATPase component